MNESEGNPHKCPGCGTPLPPDAPEGLCPRCVAANLAAGTEIKTGELGPEGTEIIKPAPAPIPSTEEIAKLFPQLEILETLGRGGMGAVYKARQPRLDRFVALKILAGERKDDPLFAERFEREARTLARLHHPNIVSIYEFGETGGNFYLLMEFVDGLTLRQLLQTRKLSPEEALAIVPKICEALQYAHQQGIVHRDIKPENILLNKAGQVKIADFGIAKIIGQQAPSGLTEEKQIIGTPHYMAPEQVERPKSVDHRADIYSLGVVLYEMLTGELPLGKFAPPSRKVQVDVRLDEVVLHALEKEPERRYQDAQQVKTDVEAIRVQPRKADEPTNPAASHSDASDKRILPAFLLAFFFGIFGAHRFYVGKVRTGLFQLAGFVWFVWLIIACALHAPPHQPTLGILLGFSTLGMLIMATIDWILLMCGAFTDGEGKKITQWLRSAPAPRTQPPAPPSTSATPPQFPPPVGATSHSKIIARTGLVVGIVIAAILLVFGLFVIGAQFVQNRFSESDDSDSDTPALAQSSNDTASTESNNVILESNGTNLSPAASATLDNATLSGDGSVHSGGSANFTTFFTTAPGGKLIMNVDRGDVRISSADTDKVEVHVAREVEHASGAEAARVIRNHRIQFRKTGNQISITSDSPSMLKTGSFFSLFGRPNLQVHYVITVPQKFLVDAVTSGGDVDVSQLQGSVRAQTMGGRVEVAEIDGNVDAKTMGGDVNVRQCKGDVRAYTAGGSIQVEEFSGPSIHAETSGGDVSADFMVSPGSDSELKTMGGNVTARLPASAAIQIDANTFGGNVNSELPVQEEGKHQDSHLRGTVNGGGPTLRLHTMGGNIDITKR